MSEDHDTKKDGSNKESYLECLWSTCEYLVSTVATILTDLDYRDSASSALAIYWVYHLFVVQYGTFAQFLDIKTVSLASLFRVDTA
jgi:hypothetical protein